MPNQTSEGVKRVHREPASASGDTACTLWATQDLVPVKLLGVWQQSRNQNTAPIGVAVATGTSGYPAVQPDLCPC